MITEGETANLLLNHSNGFKIDLLFFSACILNADHLGYIYSSYLAWFWPIRHTVQTWNGRSQRLRSCIHNMAILGYLPKAI